MFMTEQDEQAGARPVSSRSPSSGTKNHVRVKILPWIALRSRSHTTTHGRASTSSSARSVSPGDSSYGGRTRASGAANCPAEPRSSWSRRRRAGRALSHIRCALASRIPTPTSRAPWPPARRSSARFTVRSTVRAAIGRAIPRVTPDTSAAIASALIGDEMHPGHDRGRVPRGPGARKARISSPRPARNRPANCFGRRLRTGAHTTGLATRTP